MTRCNITGDLISHRGPIFSYIARRRLCLDSERSCCRRGHKELVFCSAVRSCGFDSFWRSSFFLRMPLTSVHVQVNAQRRKARASRNGTKWNELRRLRDRLQSGGDRRCKAVELIQTQTAVGFPAHRCCLLSRVVCQKIKMFVHTNTTERLACRQPSIGFVGSHRALICT